MHAALDSLYCACPNCTSNNSIVLTESKDNAPNFRDKVWRELAKWLHNKKEYKPEMLAEKEPRALIEETHRVLSQPLKSLSVTQDIPAELTNVLDKNIYHFSGFKAHHELRQASELLKDENGNIKPFNRFFKDIKSIDQTYNKQYLRAEYNFAAASTQMAVKWQEIEKDGDDYNLQYRTAGDGKVREDHAALNNTTLLPSDDFWRNFYPPNGWGCRCTAVQVRKEKYPTSDSGKAIAIGNGATSTPAQQVFRFNAGAQKKIFPTKHPYYKAPKEVKEAVDGIMEALRKEKTAEERRQYKKEMDTLLDKKVTANGNGHPMTVSFSKRGNKHILSDAIRRNIVELKDLKNLDKILDTSSFIKKDGLRKERKDDIKRFYYYKAEVNGKTIYLNIAETDFMNKKGHIKHLRFVYAITKKV
ncbi:MAG: phage minor head protein [Bacteroidales bacterium]